MNLIDESLTSALIEQLGHEKYNSSLYLYMAGYLKNRGLSNLASIFMEQYEEESNHSLMIFDLLSDLNAKIIIPEIQEISMEFFSIIDIAKAFLDREILTTESLDEIKKMAIDNQNPVVEERMREMIKLQQKEYSEATDFLDRAEITGGDWKFVMLWDIGLGK